MRAIVLGNCQSVTFRNLAERMVPSIHFDVHEAHNLSEDFASLVADYDYAFVQPHILKALSERKPFDRVKLVPFPRCSFAGFHPDLMYVTHRGEKIVTLLSLHSAIILGAWLHGLSEDETVGLFCRSTYRDLDFKGYFDATKRAFLNEWQDCGLDGSAYFDRWMAERAPFMLTINHPTMKVMAACANETLRAAGFNPSSTIDWPHHHLEDLTTHSVYPEYGEEIGVQGAPTSRAIWRGQPLDVDIARFVNDSFTRYAKYDREGFDQCKAHRPHYTAFFEARVAARPKRRKSANPYAGLPSHQHWRRSVAGVPAPEVDPVVASDFRIGPSDRVATAGSCFAQHIARALSSSGLCYYAPEKGPADQGYGLFSARYGNIYTAAQLEQLVDRAFGQFQPDDVVWQGAGGAQVDPFRPEVQLDDVVGDRESHLGFVREVVRNADYFIFTLGLTEAWRSRVDGAVFPLAPGVAGGHMDEERYEYVNFDEDETYESLAAAIRKMRAVNPALRFVLTVSPVPLMATYERRHVLVSTCYSKAVLRVVAERAARNLPNVSYFPSYEIITGQHARGAYFADDLRQVKPAGVAHVMRLFLKHCTDAGSVDATMSEIQRGMDVFCAEERLGEEHESASFPQPDVAQRLKRPAWERYLPFLKGRN